MVRIKPGLSRRIGSAVRFDTELVELIAGQAPFTCDKFNGGPLCAPGIFVSLLCSLTVKYGITKRWVKHRPKWPPAHRFDAAGENTTRFPAPNRLFRRLS